MLCECLLRSSDSDAAVEDVLFLRQSTLNEFGVFGELGGLDTVCFQRPEERLAVLLL